MFIRTAMLLLHVVAINIDLLVPSVHEEHAIKSIILLSVALRPNEIMLSTSCGRFCENPIWKDQAPQSYLRSLRRL